MVENSELFLSMLNSPVRFLRGRVEIYNGSTLELMCGCHDRLKSFTIERVGEKGKFFGFGICQKLNVHLIDKDRELDVSTANTLEVEFGTDNNYIYAYPNFYVTEVNRDENTNELSITAYDALYRASQHTVDELVLPTEYSIKAFAQACAKILDVPMQATELESFNTMYATGANFEGTETIREALDAIAEATQTIYFINDKWELVFKRLDVAGEAVLTIDREKYITLDSKTNRKLTNITFTTELEDNITKSMGVSGSTQFVRNNPFWELREDAESLVDAALAAIGGITINQFVCSWRGNFLLEIGDKIKLVTKDNETVTSYVLDDVISFNGSLNGTTQWSYTDNDGETASNPTTIGDAIKQTYARVDRANKQISIVASESSANKDAIAALQINTDSISASVTQLEESTSGNINGINEEITNIKSSVDARLTAEDVTIKIQEELSTGIDEITISGKDFTFDNRGLTIEDINPDTSNVIKTTVSNNGMVVNANNTDVLTANDIGVKARNLHANTYLMIGNNSRFEDYGYSRTGCFWIGG